MTATIVIVLGILSIAWTALFVVWYLIGIPLGPGSPVHF